MARAMTWTLPPASLLPPAPHTEVPCGTLARSLVGILRELEIPAAIHRVLVGPSTIEFQVRPDEGVRMRDFTKLGARDDIAYALEADTVRIQAPIPGKQLVGIEIPNPTPRPVALSEVVPYVVAPLRAGLGLAPDGHAVTVDLARLPHMAVAGSSGSGKSSLLHGLICSLLCQATPDELRLVLVDVKRVELGQYVGLPHLATPVVTSAPEAIRQLESLVDEVERRYELLDEAGARDIRTYNRVRAQPLPSILCVIDELGDLILQARKRVETAVVRLGQLGRACGVHLVIATQSPHREVLSGLIKANMPARVALRVASGVHSRVAIDQGGAEHLLGNGDALLQDGQSTGLQRFQACYVPEDLIESLVEHWASQVVAEPAPATEQPVAPRTVGPAAPHAQITAHHIVMAPPPRVRFTPSAPAPKFTQRQSQAARGTA